MSEPTRLSKRVIELLGCSRREADLYITGGWISVDGQVIEARNVLSSAGNFETMRMCDQAADLSPLGEISFVETIFSLDGLGVNTNENDLFSDSLPFYSLREDFNRSFPSMVDPLLVVVDGATVDLAHDAARRLAHHLDRPPAASEESTRPSCSSRRRCPQCRT